MTEAAQPKAAAGFSDLENCFASLRLCVNYIRVIGLICGWAFRAFRGSHPLPAINSFFISSTRSQLQNHVLVPALNLIRAK